ncbi:MAG: hypothetical protein CL908_04240 [Deltaproteobacteria bacterium]|nr:hypothetical protein [Deltaproteobacteria bacterium]
MEIMHRIRSRFGHPIEIPPELVARMAVGPAGRCAPNTAPNTSPKASRSRSSAAEAIATLLAVIVFGLGWAAHELETGASTPTGYAASESAGFILATTPPDPGANRWAERAIRVTKAPPEPAQPAARRSGTPPESSRP